MSDKGDFLAGAIVGAVIGLGLGLLFAPSSGTETRQRIRGRVNEFAEDVRERAAEVTSRVRDQLGETVARVRSRVRGELDDVRGGADEPEASEAIS